MGILTLDDLRDELSLILERRSDFNPSDSTSHSQLNRWINFAYRHVTQPRVFSHPGIETSQAITLVTNTRDYSLNSNLYSIEVVVLELSDHDDRLDRQEFRRLVEDRISTGTARPSRYARRAQTLYLNVYPDTDVVGRTVRVYYWLRPTALSSDSDVTVIEEYWDQVIVYLAGCYAWASLGQQQKSDYYREFAVGLINEAIGNRDLDAVDPTRGVEIEPNHVGYQEWSGR